MHGPLEKEIEEYYSKPYSKPVLAGKEFLQWLMEKVGGGIEEEKPDSKRVFRPELREIINATATFYGKTLGDLRKVRRGYENKAQAMAMYLGRTLGGYKLKEIGEILGVDKYPTVSSACSIMRTRIQTDRGLARRATRIQKSLLKHQPKT